MKSRFQIQLMEGENSKEVDYNYEFDLNKRFTGSSPIYNEDLTKRKKFNWNITHFSFDFEELAIGLATGRAGALLATFFMSYLTAEKAHITAINIVG